MVPLFRWAGYASVYHTKCMRVQYLGHFLLGCRIMFDERFLREAMGQESAEMPTGKEEGGNLDAAVIRSLLLLTSGDLQEFSQFLSPPAKIRSWIEKADRPQVHGAMISVIHRWHEVRS